MLGKNIAQRRKSLKITQAQLAEKLGVTQQYISEVEKGITTPSLARCTQIAKCLKCSVNRLIT